MSDYVELWRTISHIWESIRHSIYFQKIHAKIIRCSKWNLIKSMGGTKEEGENRLQKYDSLIITKN